MDPKTPSKQALNISSFLLYNSLYVSSFLILNISNIFLIDTKLSSPLIELNNPEENSLVKLLFINFIFP